MAHPADTQGPEDIVLTLAVDPIKDWVTFKVAGDPNSPLAGGPWWFVEESVSAYIGKIRGLS